MEKKDLRIVFMGTPEFAVESLKCLVEGSPAAPMPQAPQQGGFEAPIPTDLGTLFPRPKRQRPSAEHPLVPRTEF